VNEVIPTSSSSISGIYSPQTESQWPTEHPTLAFPIPGLHDTQGRRTGGSWLLQKDTRVDFSQGMLPPGGPWPACRAAYMRHQGGWGTRSQLAFFQ